MVKNIRNTNASWAIPKGAFTYFLIKLRKNEIKRINVRPKERFTMQNIKRGVPRISAKRNNPYLIPKVEITREMVTAITANNR